MFKNVRNNHKKPLDLKPIKVKRNLSVINLEPYNTNFENESPISFESNKSVAFKEESVSPS